MSSGSEELLELLRKSLLEGTLRKAVFSKPARKDADIPSRLDVRPVKVSNQTKFQITSRIGTQDHHRNLDAEQAANELPTMVGRDFLDVLIQTELQEVTGRHSRKGVCRLSHKSLAAPVPVAEHNRKRQYLIPDDQAVPFLIQTGVMTKDGRVKDAQRRKFRQINRYAEFIRDVVSQLDVDGPINVVDFGCGKSYLTFATHYVLTSIMNRQVNIVGLDQRHDVIDTCNKIVAALQLPDIRFQTGDIAGFSPDAHVHIAVSLHACDTATDDALAIAASWQSEAILAVPCCQHELAAQLDHSQQPLFSKHGILHERFSSLATDAMRANLMECAGYKTQVVEFIDTEHTPKNLLIRSIRRPNAQTEVPDRHYWTNFRQFSQQLSLPPLRLQQKLEEYGLLKTDLIPRD